MNRILITLLLMTAGAALWGVQARRRRNPVSLTDYAKADGPSFREAWLDRPPTG